MLTSSYIWKKRWMSEVNKHRYTLYFTTRQYTHNLQLAPVITYFRVAALPREALVEIVVTSLSTNCDFDVYLSLPYTASDLPDNFTLETKGLICQGTSPLLLTYSPLLSPSSTFLPLPFFSPTRKLISNLLLQGHTKDT